MMTLFNSAEDRRRSCDSADYRQPNRRLRNLQAKHGQANEIVIIILRSNKVREQWLLGGLLGGGADIPVCRERMADKNVCPTKRLFCGLTLLRPDDYNCEAVCRCHSAGGFYRGRTGFDRIAEVSVACRGWSAGHVKSRPISSIAEGNFALAA